jgi:hypothetical protein
VIADIFVIVRLIKSVKRDPVIWLTGFASLALLIYMNIHHGPLFTALTAGEIMPDIDINVTRAGLLALREILIGKPDAAAVLFNMHLYADMALPALLGTFLFLLILRLAPGTVLYGRPTERLLPILLALPICYGFCDYSENVVSLLLFPPATPSDSTAISLAGSLYWATRLKFVFGVVSVIVTIRLMVGNLIARGGFKSPQ